MGPIIVVQLDVRNNSDYVVTRTIPRGQIVEVADPAAVYQNATVVREYVVTIPPQATATVFVEARCLNSGRSWPAGTSANLTPFAFRGPFSDQNDLWAQMPFR